MNSRRLVLCLLAALLVALASSALYAQEATRVASINVELVVAEAREGKELAAFLQQIETETRTALEANAARVEALRQGAVGKGPDELRSIQHQIEDLQRESQRLANDVERRAAKRQEETLQQINERLRPIVQQLIDENGYDLILNASIGGVLHASARVDLTPRVISMLQAQEQQEEAGQEP
ncbi:MAG: OmpH family outer membrane protein [Holophagales bacterium]|nr:OmpH family outer membrane protein [Holophagales bacterium]MYG29179.1 OmpH family outer membrane protein [Holophagales bacterium]MYI81251.1 OmpH family outer membrane protein [Holophagales bacterium]